MIWLSGMMGLIVGDALGSPVQFMDRESIALDPVTGMRPCEFFDMPPGAWTDDSSMALAILDALIQKEGYDLSAIADNFVKWLYEGEFTPFGFAFDIGFGCKSGIERYRKTGDATTSGNNGIHDNGNGSLMRTLPLCMYYALKRNNICTSDNEAIAAIHAVSGITHGHIQAQMGCGLYYFCVKHILDNRDTKSLQECLQEGLDEGFKYYGNDIRNVDAKSVYKRLYDLDELGKLPSDEIKTSGYVVHSLEAAIWNLITTSSYKECELQAVNMGDDADTVGAIAGGLAGLYYGYENIPMEWLDTIIGTLYINEMCEMAERL